MAKMGIITIDPYGSKTDVVSYLRSQGITKLYHFTDRANIQSIIDNGGLYSWQACEQKGITINRPGGNGTSRSLDSNRGLGNYVRLSFTKKHPMMYVAKNDGRISNPVILEIDLSVAQLSTTKFSDRNATKNGVIIATGYDGAKNIHFSTITQLNHFDLMPNEKEFYQAEVLVYEKVPITCISNIDDYRPKPQTMHMASRAGDSTNPSYTSSSGSNSPSSYKPSYSSSSSSNNANNNSSGGGCLWVIIIGIIIAVIVGISG